MGTTPIIEQLQRSSHRAAAGSFVAATIVIASLVYSAANLHSLQEKREALEKANRETDQLLQEKQELVKRLDLQIAEKQSQNQVLQTTLLQVGSSSTESAKQTNLAIRNAIEAHPETAQLLPRVYLHIRKETQRAKSKTVAVALVAGGFSVPGIEFVGNKAPRENQLRYFEKNEQGTKDGIAILQVLEKMNVRVNPVYIPPNPTLGPMRPRHYEIWFGPEF